MAKTRPDVDDLAKAIAEADDEHWLDYSADKGDFCHCGAEHLGSSKQAEEHRIACITGAVYIIAKTAVQDAYNRGYNDAHSDLTLQSE